MILQSLSSVEDIIDVNPAPEQTLVVRFGPVWGGVIAHLRLDEALELREKLTRLLGDDATTSELHDQLDALRDYAAGLHRAAAADEDQDLEDIAASLDDELKPATPRRRRVTELVEGGAL